MEDKGTLSNLRGHLGCRVSGSYWWTCRREDAGEGEGCLGDQKPELECMSDSWLYTVIHKGV